MVTGPEKRLHCCGIHLAHTIQTLGGHAMVDNRTPDS